MRMPNGIDLRAFGDHLAGQAFAMAATGVDPPTARAARGARRLDVWHAGWEWTSRRPIRVQHGDDCPLGQIYGGYDRAPAQLVYASLDCGFIALDVTDLWTLNLAWEDEIRRRRRAALADMVVDEHGSSPAGRRFEASARCVTPAPTLEGGC
jgi:hypothetical protein